MIASWIAFTLLVGALATIGAEAADRVLRARGRPARGVWIAALAFSAGWPAWLAFRPQAVVESPLSVSVQSTAFAVSDFSRAAFHLELDTLLLTLWVLASAGVAVRLAWGVFRLASRRRHWRRAQVDGVDVRVSDDVGPAVVGLRPMEVVLPDWALSLDAPLRAIVLRHEEEHRRAADPALLAFAALLLVVAPWNVAFWWQARRLRLAIELDCDARVLSAFPHPERYGLLLLSIAQRRSGARTRLATGLLEPGHHLERRIAAMTDGFDSLSRTRIAALATLGAVAIVGACNADAPPQPVSSSSAQVEEPAIEHPGDSMVVVSRREYERLKAIADRLRQIDSAGVIEDDVRTKLPTPTIRLAERGVVLRDTSSTGAAEGDRAYWDFQIDVPAQWYQGTGAPRYPDILKTAGVTGSVKASFVVGTDGRADLSTFKVHQSTHELFSVAVRNALPQMRFQPAQVGGRRVKQVVQQEFTFTIDK